jgi:hypothetical protein
MPKNSAARRSFINAPDGATPHPALRATFSRKREKGLN